MASRTSISSASPARSSKRRPAMDFSGFLGVERSLDVVIRLVKRVLLALLWSQVRTCWPIEFAELGSGYAGAPGRDIEVSGKGNLFDRRKPHATLVSFEVLYFQFLAFLMMIFAVHLCLQARCGSILSQFPLRESCEEDLKPRCCRCPVWCLTLAPTTSQPLRRASLQEKRLGLVF